MCRQKTHKNPPLSARKSRNNDSNNIKFNSDSSQEDIEDSLLIPVTRKISSRTLDPESTSKEKVSSPFYNESSMEKFQKLWLPQMTEFPDLIMNFLNGFSSSSGVNSFLLTVPKKNLPNKSLLK